MLPEFEALVRERAHRIWERSQQPSGSAEDHWLEAERELREEQLLPESTVGVPLTLSLAAQHPLSRTAYRIGPIYLPSGRTERSASRIKYTLSATTEEQEVSQVPDFEWAVTNDVRHDHRLVMAQLLAISGVFESLSVLFTLLLGAEQGRQDPRVYYDASRQLWRVKAEFLERALAGEDVIGTPRAPDRDLAFDIEGLDLGSLRVTARLRAKARAGMVAASLVHASQLAGDVAAASSATTATTASVSSAITAGAAALTAVTGAVTAWANLHPRAGKGLVSQETLAAAYVEDLRTPDLHERVKLVQEMLNLVGGYRLAEDGVLGPETRAALNTFGASRHIVSVDDWSHARLAALASEAAARRAQTLNSDPHP